MNYSLCITKAAEEQLDQIIQHLVYTYQNSAAASHLIHSIDKIYFRLETNPYQFSICKNLPFIQTEYREAVLTEMNYIIIFHIQNECVYVSGICHQLENYPVYF